MTAPNHLKDALVIAEMLRPLGTGEEKEKDYGSNKKMVDAMRDAVYRHDRKLADHPVFDSLEEIDRACFMENVEESPYRFRSFQAMPEGFCCSLPAHGCRQHGFS